MRRDVCFTGPGLSGPPRPRARGPRLGGRIAGRAAAHAGARGDRDRASAHARGVRARRARARVREPRARLLRPGARRRADPAQGAHRRSTATRPSGSRSPAASSSRSSGSRSPARSRRSTATPTRSRSSQVLSIGFVVNALGAPQQSLMLRDMDFRRVEILPMIGALGGRRGRRGDRRDRRRRLGDHRPVRGRPRRVTTHRGLAALAVEAALRLLLREPAGPRRLQRLHARPPDALLPPDQRRPLPHRPLPGHRRARRLRDRLQHDHPAGEQASADRSSA